MNENKDGQSLIDLTNPAFTFKFADREFQIKKANIEQIQQYLIRLQDLSKDTVLLPLVRDLSIVSYCIFLVLHKADKTVAEDFVKENMRGDVDPIQVLTTLGFMTPTQANFLQRAQKKVEEVLTPASDSRK
jgi:hypothetical protein